MLYCFFSLTDHAINLFSWPWIFSWLLLIYSFQFRSRAASGFISVEFNFQSIPYPNPNHNSNFYLQIRWSWQGPGLGCSRWSDEGLVSHVELDIKSFMYDYRRTTAKSIYELVAWCVLARTSLHIHSSVIKWRESDFRTTHRLILRQQSDYRPYYAPISFWLSLI